MLVGIPVDVSSQFFVQLIPMQTRPAAADLVLGALYRCGVQETGKLRQRHAELAAIYQTQPQHVALNALIFRQRIHAKLSQ